jgi:hypothetical protein
LFELATSAWLTAVFKLPFAAHAWSRQSL